MSGARSRPPPCDAAAHAVPAVRELRPYQPGKPTSELEREYGVHDIVKLASNENPLGPGPAAIEALQSELPDLALYPDGGGFELRHALAERHGIGPECITLGNGSNDVLVLLAEAFLSPGREAVFSQYAFAVYPIATQACGARARVAPARPSTGTQPLGHDLAAMAERVTEHTRIVFIANPNNPTGTWLEASELLAFLESVPDETLVVVDEAYHEYALARGVPDATPWLERFPNLVITRTFSKAHGLAGLRVGYSLSAPEIADLMNRVRQPFNVNSLALAAARAALGDRDFIARSVELNRAGGEQLHEGLKRLGLRPPPSAGNFLLLNLARSAGPVYEALLRRGIIVRPLANYGLPEHLRVTIGSRHQNDLFLEALGRTLTESTTSETAR